MSEKSLDHNLANQKVANDFEFATNLMVNTARHIVISSCGTYLPKNIVTNDDLPKHLETSDEWIQKRTGIKQRHIAAADETTSDMAAKALQQALQKANLKIDDLDAVIVATSTPDLFMPSTAVLVQNKLGGSGRNMAFDLNAACSGFVYALEVGYRMLKENLNWQNVAIIGADSMSKIVDWNDRSTCVLFGDGAGAVILNVEYSKENTEFADLDSEPGKNRSALNLKKQSGIIDFITYGNAKLCDILNTKSGVSNQNLNDYTISMVGKEVFKHAVAEMSQIAQQILAKNGFTVDDVDFIVPHQANMRILTAIEEKLGIAKEGVSASNKMATSVIQHANTSAATIPLALDMYLQQGKIKKGDLLLMLAAGAGMVFGGVLLRW